VFGGGLRAGINGGQNCRGADSPEAGHPDHPWQGTVHFASNKSVEGHHRVMFRLRLLDVPIPTMRIAQDKVEEIR
jgi:hypothetical protein